MRLHHRLVAALAITLTLGALTAARADTITFAGPAADILPGDPATVEGSFRYDAISGGLFRAEGRGNPTPDIEGLATTGGGVLRVVRNDVAGGLFTFDASDIAQFRYGSSQPITFTGFLGGVSQGVDIFGTSATNDLFTTVTATNLSGVLLDELQVTLPADVAAGARWTAADNLVVTPAASGIVPEPGTALLLASGVLPLVGMAVRRQRGA